MEDPSIASQFTINGASTRSICFHSSSETTGAGSPLFVLVLVLFLVLDSVSNPLREFEDEDEK
jgi:hypothetical protein